MSFYANLEQALREKKNIHTTKYFLHLKKNSFPGCLAHWVFFESQISLVIFVALQSVLKCCVAHVTLLSVDYFKLKKPWDAS